VVLKPKSPKTMSQPKFHKISNWGTIPWRSLTDMARLLWHLGGEVGHGYDMATASRLPFGVSKVFKSVSKCAKVR